MALLRKTHCSFSKFCLAGHTVFDCELRKGEVEQLRRHLEGDDQQSVLVVRDLLPRRCGRCQGQGFGAALEKLIEHGKADDISADAEQLKLHAAALPDSDPLRAQLLASADSATTFVQSGLALGWLYLCNLQVSSDQFISFPQPDSGTNTTKQTTNLLLIFDF